MATDRWTDKANFTTFLSNAATLTSLVLGVIAIFYSIVSNSDISKSIGNIKSVSEMVDKSNQHLAQFVLRAEGLTQTGKENTLKLEEVSTSVGTQVASLRNMLDAVNVRTQELHASVNSIPMQISQLENKFEDATKELKVQNGSLHAGTTKSTSEPTDAQVKRFIEKSPLIVNLTMYACALSYSSQKPLSLAVLVAEAPIPTTDDYLHGYIVSMDSYGLLSRKLLKELGPRTYQIASIHPTLASYTRSYMEQYIEKEYGDKKATVEKWQARLKKVEELFS